MAILSPKKVLADLGFDVVRVPPAARTLASETCHTQGWLVELVGPSGVGKTTLKQQVAPKLQGEWFFEQHAKGLLGQVSEDPTLAAYIKTLMAGRLDRLAKLDAPLEHIAMIGQRVCEVVRLGLVSKAEGLPRGFLMDDGMLHFFAEQIIAQPPDNNNKFLDKTACIFLLPDPQEIASSTGQARQQLDVYLALRDLVQDHGCPTLILERGNSARSPDHIVDFLAKNVPGP